MPVIYDTYTKSQRMQGTRDAIDAGSGPGSLEICTAGYATVLRVFTLSDPCGTIAGPVLTLSGFPRTDGNGPAGTPAAARIKDSDGNIRINGLTVGTSAADVIVNKATLSEDEDLQIASATVTHAPNPV